MAKEKKEKDGVRYDEDGYPIYDSLSPLSEEEDAKEAKE